MTQSDAIAASSDELSDGEVVRRVVAGDRGLFEIVIRRYNQRIYRTVRAILGDEIEVEDVMQQVYLNAFRHLQQYEGAARLSTWLTTIAVREAAARLRRRKREPGTGAEEVIMAFADEHHPSPERQAEASELRAIVERDVAALPQPFRVVLMLREVEGLSTAETAACLDISEDLVKTRLHRARAMLREKLQRRSGMALGAIFAFGNERCDRIVATVMDSTSDYDLFDQSP